MNFVKRIIRTVATFVGLAEVSKLAESTAVSVPSPKAPEVSVPESVAVGSTGGYSFTTGRVGTFKGNRCKRTGRDAKRLEASNRLASRRAS
jgi:hypothetical protein